MKLYGSLASPYVARVIMFARLKGIALAPQMPQGGIKSAEYLAKNPMGKMPVLEMDGVAIPESEVICELLDDLHPGTGGLPGGPIDRGRVRRRVFGGRRRFPEDAGREIAQSAGCTMTRTRLAGRRVSTVTDRRRDWPARRPSRSLCSPTISRLATFSPA